MRFKPLSESELSAEQKVVYRKIADGPRGGVRGPFDPLLRCPELCDRAQRLGEFCRYHSSLAPVLSEFAIIVTARYWRAQYEFFAHARMARAAGVSDAIVEAVRTGTEPPLEDERHRAIYAFVTEYFATHRVADATYERAIAALGERGVVDLVGIVGYYSLVSLTLNVFEVALPDGEADPLP